MLNHYAAVIQAGGKGTRLKSLTGDKIPKPLLMLNGKPMIQWQIENLKAWGISQIVIIIGHLGEKIREYFGDGAELGVEISYIRESVPLGSAGALYDLKDRWTDRDFLLVFGDVMFDVDLESMVRFHEGHGGTATLLVHPNSHPYDSDLTVMDEDCRIVRFDSKENTRNYWYDNCVNAGIYVLSGRLLGRMTERKRCDLEKDLLAPLAEEGQVYGYRTAEYVKDAGTVERFWAVSKAQARGLWSMKNRSNPQRCIFLDRDGTVNRYAGLISKEGQLELEEHAAEAIKLINESGYLAIIVTNQPVVARGMCSMEQVNIIHRKLQVLLGEKGAYLDDIAFCPHHPDKGYPEENPEYKIPCSCRKPSAGMIDQMAERYHIDRSESYMVGDTTVDVQTGINGGLKTVLVHTGMAGKDGKYPVKADMEASDLLEAVKQILQGRQQEERNMKDYTEDIRTYISLEEQVLKNLPVEEINTVMNVLEHARLSGRRIFICGNGGSASTASHYECDFNKGVSYDQEIKYDFECLSDNVPMMMAIANDIGYDDIFVTPLRNKLKSGDVVIGISGSGNSENVVRAIRYANETGADTIAICGYGGGRIKELAKYNIHVNIDNMQIVEDMHLVLNHLMMYILSGMKGC